MTTPTEDDPRLTEESLQFMAQMLFKYQVEGLEYPTLAQWAGLTEAETRTALANFAAFVGMKLRPEGAGPAAAWRRRLRGDDGQRRAGGAA